MTMTISDRGLNFLKNHEGIRLVAYKPVPSEKYWTIGFGHCGPDVKPGMVITMQKALEFLKSDLGWVYWTIQKEVKVPLNQNQFDALVSFIYNIGGGAFRASTALRLLNNGNYAKVPWGMALYNKDASKRINKVLVKRRAEEGAMFKEKSHV